MLGRLTWPDAAVVEVAEAAVLVAIGAPLDAAAAFDVAFDADDAKPLVVPFSL